MKKSLLIIIVIVILASLASVMLYYPRTEDSRRSDEGEIAKKIPEAATSSQDEKLPIEKLFEKLWKSDFDETGGGDSSTGKIADTSHDEGTSDVKDEKQPVEAQDPYELFNQRMDANPEVVEIERKLKPLRKKYNELKMRHLELTNYVGRIIDMIEEEYNQDRLNFIREEIRRRAEAGEEVADADGRIKKLPKLPPELSQEAMKREIKEATSDLMAEARALEVEIRQIESQIWELQSRLIEISNQIRAELGLPLIK